MAETNQSNDKESWMKDKWRPAMGWMYMIVCVFDFILFPILWAIIQFWENNAANDAFRQWDPLTLQGAGLFHMAMGAVLGVAAWSRGQEKIAGVANPSTGNPQTFSVGQPVVREMSYETRAKPAYYSGQTFTSKQGKSGPVIEEPEL